MIFLGVMRMAFTFILDVPKEQNVKKAETYLQSIDTSFAVNDNDLRKQYSNELEKFRAELDEYKIRLSSYAKEYHDIPMGKSLQESLEVLELIKEHTSLEECQRGNLSKLNSQYLPAVIALLEQYKNLSSFKNTTIKVKAVLKELSDTVIASKTVFTNILEEAIADEKLNAEVDSKIFLNTAVQNGLYADRNTLVMRQTEDEDK
ncbi:hypothetical protein bpr_II266 (plasmid) [Butyrivibrio proteoclasticus B316]|uniref:Uncharacterized protein n=2 Tax=Butyrivibrio proteoclasticus TaxID=43305 RepID=E0S471_BUTPB|nr:hypothetical protein bpr_II266 [Butyrivibrio proteoclasticus B316]